MPNSETADPGNAKPQADATLRLPIGNPVQPEGSRPLGPAEPQDPGSTLKLPLGGPEANPGETQKLVRPGAEEPPLHVQSMEPPQAAIGQDLSSTLHPEDAKTSLGWKVPLALALLAVLGVVAYLSFPQNPLTPRTAPTGLAPASEAVPPSVQAILEQAKAGDVHSMHLLGLMYYNGLNMPKDREKGLHWLRKAAEKGSDAARAELGQIEGGH